jgi:serine/threonine-protein kinase RsbW
VWARGSSGNADAVFEDAVSHGSTSLDERLPARSQSIARLRHAATAFAGRHGASDSQREDIALAVSEAVSNAVKHAYPGRNEDGTVQLYARISDAMLEVLVCDDGDGMQPRSTSPGLGLGLAVIGRVTQELQVESRDPAPGVRVRMTFAIG